MHYVSEYNKKVNMSENREWIISSWLQLLLILTNEMKYQYSKSLCTFGNVLMISLPREKTLKSVQCIAFHTQNSQL